MRCTLKSSLFPISELSSNWTGCTPFCLSAFHLSKSKENKLLFLIENYLFNTKCNTIINLHKDAVQPANLLHGFVNKKEKVSRPILFVPRYY